MSEKIEIRDVTSTAEDGHLTSPDPASRQSVSLRLGLRKK